MIALALAGSLATLTAGASGEQEKSSRPTVTSPSSGMPVPGSPTRNAVPAPESVRTQARVTMSECEPSSDGLTRACLHEVDTDDVEELPVPQNQVSSQTIQPLPEFCTKSVDGGFWGTRTQLCELRRLKYSTERLQNGIWVLTGSASMRIYPYAYTSTTLPVWAHQIQVSAYFGWGDALNATVQGEIRFEGNCTRLNSAFPRQNLSPLHSFKDGEASFETTVRISGAKGACTTTWDLLFLNGSYTPEKAEYAMLEIRCDNATAGTTTIGCVVPWSQPEMYYSRSQYPSLAAHVERAQASGLPGGQYGYPLTYTTNSAIVDANRQLACGDAPSIAGLSCDEYPIATSREGLSAGGTRRTFEGCNFALPGQTGYSGVSVCMITATENNAQGGIHTQFNRRERMLDGDTFRIYISP
ncbi:NucA/NucB deoxyribonuclease domain-containing protein [Actinosynnema sp. CS-041913]|uniref:NucA/NucB deoxyribonuclease domain-containing protein n=1 Tax=Actinosynnema sp. CS-041913 TaxID=3239917 RepID=UPI003D8F9036